MAIETNQLPALEFILRVERFYAGLMRHAVDGSGSEPGLGGELLWVGELDSDGRALAVAANIAGAASLSATADSDAQKQAIRDGVADFLVTSLDEALRILKNEIRKHEPVAVCVALAPDLVEREMVERGVRPDLIPGGSGCTDSGQIGFGAAVQCVEPVAAIESETLLTWSVASAPAQWLPKLDAIALDCLSAEPRVARRWLRLAPRYLGRLARGMHVLRCDDGAAKNFIARVRLGMECGEIPVAVEMHEIKEKHNS
jgi:hypothetical protein